MNWAFLARRLKKTTDLQYGLATRFYIAASMSGQVKRSIFDFSALQEFFFISSGLI